MMLKTLIDIGVVSAVVIWFALLGTGIVIFMWKLFDRFLNR